MFCSKCGTKITGNAGCCSGYGCKLVTDEHNRDDLLTIYTRESVRKDYLQGRISKSKLDNMIMKQQIPYFRLGNRVLFRKGELDDWIKAIQTKM